MGAMLFDKGVYIDKAGKKSAVKVVGVRVEAGVELVDVEFADGSRAAYVSTDPKANRKVYRPESA